MSVDKQKGFFFLVSVRGLSLEKVTSNMSRQKDFWGANNSKVSKITTSNCMTRTLTHFHISEY